MTKEELEQMAKDISSPDQALTFIKIAHKLAEDEKEYETIDSMEIFEANKKAQEILFLEKVKPLREEAEKEKSKLDQMQNQLYDVSERQRQRYIKANETQDERRQCKPWELTKKKDLEKKIEELRKPLPEVKDTQDRIEGQKTIIEAINNNVKSWENQIKKGNMTEFRMLTRCEKVKFYTTVNKTTKTKTEQTEDTVQRTTSPTETKNVNKGVKHQEEKKKRFTERISDIKPLNKI